MASFTDATSRQLTVREILEEDRQWVSSLLIEHWSSPTIVTRGRRHDASQAPGFVALLDGELSGLATYRIEGAECEILTLNALIPNAGVGSRLIAHVRQEAGGIGCTRLWLITTNDNATAQRFFERCGFALVAVHVGAVAESRKLKPSIPLLGPNGVPIRDELEYELHL